jgi:hypothetical protein
MSSNQHDAIDEALAALRNAAPPEGMEARIACHLAQQASESQRDTATAHAWWRGAAAGAAVATLAMAAVLFAQHHSQAMPQNSARAAAAANAGVVSAAYIKGSPTANDRGTPCAKPALLRVQLAAAPPRMELTELRIPAQLRVATTAPSKPAPALPLTAQERELLRLARTADPKQLAAFDEETQAKLEAQQAEDFEKFFTPPPAPPEPTATEENE